MNDQELKKQFKQEEKELEEITNQVKTIILSKNFEIAWRFGIKDNGILINKQQEILDKLCSFMKEYGIFYIEAKKIEKDNKPLLPEGIKPISL